MATEWTLVRVSCETKKLLESIRQSMVDSHVQGRILLESDDRGRVSLDQVIRRLAACRLQHQARARKQRRSGAGQAK